MSARPQAGERPAFLDSWPPLATLDLERGKPLLLVFLRGFWCDYCRRQLQELVEQATAFQSRGVRIVAITTDPEVVDEVGDTFLVLVDDAGALVRQLDLVDPFEFRPVPVALPAVYLLDGAGVVRFHYVGRSPDDRPRTELLLLAAEHLPTGTS